MTYPQQPDPDSGIPVPPASDTNTPHPAEPTAQGYPAQYPPNQYPAYPAAPPAAPGSGLAVAGLILAILLPLIGLIISIVAFVKLRKANAPRGVALAGIIIGAVLTLGWLLILGLGIVALVGVAGTCAELGPGVWQVDGVTYTCG